MGQCPDRPTVVGGRTDLTSELPQYARARLRLAAGKGSWRMDGWRVGRSVGWMGYFFEIRSLEAPEKT